MKRMGHWSIGRRLALGFGALIAVVAGFVAAVFVFQRDSAQAQEAFVERIAPRREAAIDLERAIVNVAIAVRTHLLTPNTERANRTLDAVNETRKALHALQEIPKEPDGLRLYMEAAPRVEHYLAEASSATRLSAIGNAVAVEASLAQAREDALRAVHAYVDLQRQKMHQAIAAMEHSRERISRGLLMAVIFVTAALVALGIVVTLSIRTPARELTRIAREMKGGNWHPALHFAPRQVEARGESASPGNELAQIALALGSAAEALERRERRLSADAQVARAASSSLEREPIAEQALAAMAEATGAAAGAVYWRERESDELLPIAHRALAGPAEPLRMGEGLPGCAALEARMVVLGDLPADSPMRLRLGVESLPPQAVAAVPIMLRGEVLGVAVLASVRRFEAHELEFLKAAALQLAIGLHNVRSHEEAQTLLRELREAHEQVQAQNEELQAQSEELQAQSEELQAQSEELQTQAEELHDRNEELQVRTMRLAQADERKNDFLGLLAHELRNPLAAVGTSLFILGRAGARSEPEAKSLAVIERQMRYLTRLIDDLLDVTRITRGKLHLQREPLDLREVVRDGVHDCRTAAHAAGLDLQMSLTEVPAYVQCDRTRLAQVLGNLLSNAIKFTPRGGRVEAALRVDAGEGKVAVHVRDTGIGIEPALAERLFQPFSQGDMGLARGNGGLGLGLAISRALVELHEGRIELRGAGTGPGAEFVVTLPLGSARPAAAAEAPHPGRHEPRRILVIEDNEDAAETLRMALESEGHHVVVARSGPEGVEMACASPPEIVLCDIGIPGMDGFEVAHRLRGDARLDRTTLVALSGYATADDRRRSSAAGFDKHLAKPVAMEALLQVVAAPMHRAADGVTA